MSQTSFSIISLAVRFHLTIKRRVGGARVGGARVEGDNSQRRELQAHASTSALVLCSSISVLGNFDLLLLLSDIDGLYNGPSSDPQSKLINTYVKERHQGQIAFGDKSRLGRRGMTAKVKAAVYAAYAGVPLIIASKTADGIINVLEGQRIGTLFHKDAHSWDPIKETGARFLERALGGFRRPCCHPPS